MWHRCKNNCAFLPSRLARALWIEMVMPTGRICWWVSRLARALWIEIFSTASVACAPLSRLARALWIEIFSTKSNVKRYNVEARESLVDRNCSCCHCRFSGFVEARESLVDRNTFWQLCTPSAFVSRLARALWIEIYFFTTFI